MFLHRVTVDLVKLDRTAVKSDHLTTLPEEKSTKIISSSERAMGCSASRADGLEHEEALQHVIQMMRELMLDLGAGGLADGINSLQADGGSGERLLEHFVSIRGEGSRAPPMWGLLSLSLETSSCVIYTFFQRSGNRERYAVVIRGVICGLS